jgi:hypothetical protein|tara:strand:+ start:68708 stop:69508 length:801 start_codon:yes stop_codon:yes gene_type:complete
MLEVPDNHFVFVAGTHRSGTSLLHTALRAHPEISGFSNTGKPMDEGQHLQSVFPAAKRFGGPGRFAFDPASFMNESHPLATRDNAMKLFSDWSSHWDLRMHYLIEKSPPTIIRMRFFQHLFPNSSFVVILRHPVAVAYATLKWCPSSAFSLIEHTLRCYEGLLADKSRIRKLIICRYEDLVANPQHLLARIHTFLGVNKHQPRLEIDTQSNQRYFARWKPDFESLDRLQGVQPGRFKETLGPRLCALGYLIDSVDQFVDVPWIDTE